MLKLMRKFIVGIVLMAAFPALATFESQDEMLKALMAAGAGDIVAFDDGVVSTRVLNPSTGKIERKHLESVMNESDREIPALNYYQSELLGKRLWKARQIGDSFVCYVPERNILEQLAAENLHKDVYAPCFLITEKVSAVLERLP